jgi:single-strand DNA-binding protein
VNSVNIIGTLGRDPELKMAGSSALAKFSIAVNTGYGDKKATSWFDVIAWTKTAEFIEKYFKKGSRIAVTGRLNQETWEKDGEKRSRVVIVAERASFADSKQQREPGDDSFEPAAEESTDEL